MTQPLVVLTQEQILELVRAAVREALAAAPGRKLIDRQTLASQLGCSVSQIDLLRKRGLPVIRVGEAVRFDPSEVLDWLRTRDASD